MSGPVRIAAAVLAFGLAISPFGALAQKAPQAEPFGREKVETREFRNKDVERALNTPQNAGHKHDHGKKGHQGHNH